MVAPALCIPCMAAVTTTGPAAPIVEAPITNGAAGYYSLKKSKKKKKKKSNKKKKKKTKQRGGTKLNKKKCCKCRYVKSGKSLRRVKGPWPHCSYDMENCCKDKKTIVKSKD